MKCPKCGYLGFEQVDRCRNCGYEFSLVQTAAPPELAIRHASTDVNPIDDFTLIDRATPIDELPQFASERDADLDRGFGASAKSAVSLDAPEELPLFGGPIADDVPLITKPSRPRPPLAVRRSTPEVPRLKAEPARSQMLDLEAFDSSPRRDELYVRGAGAGRSTAVEENAALGARFLAVAMDLVLLAIVDLVVVYLTMAICGLTMADLGILPKGPLLAFLFVQNGSYLVAFTAGGQTLGKMAAGIRVVAAESDSTLDVGRALVRTLVWLVLAVPAGLGFLTALLSRDHRGLHDRFSGTRVVRAL